MQKRLHKINQHFLIPIMWLFGSSSFIALGYLVSEYFTTEDKFISYYSFSTIEITQYKHQVLLFIIANIAIIFLEIYCSRIKKWWLTSILIILNFLLLFNLVKIA